MTVVAFVVPPKMGWWEEGIDEEMPFRSLRLRGGVGFDENASVSYVLDALW